MTYNTEYKHTTHYEGRFLPSFHEKHISDDALIFCFHENDILLSQNKIPTHQQLVQLDVEIQDYIYIGTLANNDCFAATSQQNENTNNTSEFIFLRLVYNILDEEHLKVAIFAQQILLWNKRTKYCSICGSPTKTTNTSDFVKRCSSCNEDYYPRISPAIIVAISKNDKLLMAQHHRLDSRFTIIAGFVNPGESLEECVHREVKEETGIEIENVKYFGSQTWPFPDSLMIGFKAKYKQGELIPDGKEIMSLKWFSANEIPEWPNRSSISRALIDDFIKENS